MSPGSTTLSVVYRAPSQFPLLGVLEHGGFLAQQGLDIGFELIEESKPAETALLEEGADFIFGSHIGPYNRLAKGVPMVCLASTVNVTLESFASRAPIGSLADV